MNTVVSFPGLGIGTYMLNRVAFTLFGVIEVRRAGLLTALAILLAILYAAWRGKRHEHLGGTDVADVGLIAVLCGVVGARAFYVLFTLGKGYYEHFGDVIDVWNGGMEFYGALIGGCIGIMLTCPVKHLSWKRLLDAAAPGVLLAQAVGVWGNFLDGKAHGSVIEGYTVFDLFGMELTLPSGQGTLFHALRMGLEKYGTFAYYHPTVLYECVWSVIGLVILNIFYKRKKFHGQIALMYFSWYGLGSVLIGGFRADSLLIPGTPLRIAQCLGALCVAVATVLPVRLCRKYADNDPFACPAPPRPDDVQWKNKEDNPLSRALERVLVKRKTKNEENKKDGNKN